MHLSHILHPEIALGRRGPADFVELYRETIGHLHKNERGTYVSKDISPLGLEILKRHEVVRTKVTDHLDFRMLDHLFLVQKFCKEKAPVYYVPETFASALSKVDRGLAFKFLPEEFFGFIALPKNGFSVRSGGETHQINGGYIYIGSGPSKDLPPSFPIGVRYVMISLTSDEKFFGIMLPLEDGKTLNECLESKSTDDAELIKTQEAQDSLLIHKILLNAVLFIHHESKDVLLLRPTSNRTGKAKKDVIAGNQGNTNACTIPVKLLNFSFHQKRQYLVDSTVVSGHFRWQPYGKELSQLKLIWINEHERSYK
jgi:hypothetical protein